MRHAEESDLGSEMPGIAGDLEQGGSAGAEEQAGNQSLVVQGKRSQFTRKGEYRMDIARGQQLPFALLQPTDAGVALAPWAMPVATRVIRDGGVPAAGALIAMPAQRGGAATRDRQQHLLMLPVDSPTAAFYEALPGTANDIGHLQRRPVQTLRIGSPCAISESM